MTPAEGVSTSPAKPGSSGITTIILKGYLLEWASVIFLISTSAIRFFTSLPAELEIKN